MFKALTADDNEVMPVVYPTDDKSTAQTSASQVIDSSPLASMKWPLKFEIVDDFI